MTILNPRGNNSSRHRLYVIPPAGSNVGSVIGTLPDIHVLLTSVPSPKVVSPATNQETPHSSCHCSGPASENKAFLIHLGRGLIKLCWLASGASKSHGGLPFEDSSSKNVGYSSQVWPRSSQLPCSSGDQFCVCSILPPSTDARLLGLSDTEL